MALEKIKATVLDSAQIDKALRRIAQEIVETQKELENLVFIGLLARGLPLAQRLAKIIEDNEKVVCPVGSLDIALFRDDLGTSGKLVEVRRSDIPFDINHKTVILVDDVIYRGRTIRAALDSLNAYGRPAAVRLVALIDRGHRELPIQPDFTGKKITTYQPDEVAVHLKELDGQDEVVVV